MPLALALYQPDIPQNLGSILRLCACFNVTCHIIEPCGFIFDDKRIRRAGLDYIEQVNVERHVSWEKFLEQMRAQHKRIVLLTTKGDVAHHAFAFDKDDVLLLGRESAGVPENVAKIADARICIPMVPPARSLNIAIAGGVVLAEALRQVKWR